MRLLSLIGLLAIVVGIAALVFFFGGFFNVAATNAEPDAGQMGADQGAHGGGRPLRHRPAALRL